METKDIIRRINLPQLEGTEKQIEAAENIRRDIISLFEERFQGCIDKEKSEKKFSLDDLAEDAAMLEIFFRKYKRAADLIDFGKQNKDTYIQGVKSLYGKMSEEEVAGDLEKWDKIVSEWDEMFMSKQDRLNAFFGRDPDPAAAQAYKNKVARYEAAKKDGNYITIPGWAINADGEIIVWRNSDGIWETLDSQYAALISDLARTIAGHLHTKEET